MVIEWFLQMLFNLKNARIFISIYSRKVKESRNINYYRSINKLYKLQVLCHRMPNHENFKK